MGTQSRCACGEVMSTLRKTLTKSCWTLKFLEARLIPTTWTTT